MLKSRDNLKATRWFKAEPVGIGGKGWMSFALQEAQRAKQWVWDYMQEKKLPEGDTAYQATQLRRKYLAGKPILHTVPGVIFVDVGI